MRGERESEILREERDNIERGVTTKAKDRERKNIAKNSSGIGGGVGIEKWMNGREKTRKET